MSRYDKDKQRAYRKDYQQRRRLEVLKHYSKSDNPYCGCCKENHLEFLALDHANGDGAQQRREKKPGGYSNYTRLITAGFPEGYRILCHNCNQAISWYGYCPHEGYL